MNNSQQMLEALEQQDLTSADSFFQKALEEDLDEILHDRLVYYLPESKGNPIEYLQASKNYHMVELADKLSYSECQIIYDSYNFACLKELIEG